MNANTIPVRMVEYVKTLNTVITAYVLLATVELIVRQVRPVLYFNIKETFDVNIAHIHIEGFHVMSYQINFASQESQVKFKILL